MKIFDVIFKRKKKALSKIVDVEGVEFRYKKIKNSKSVKIRVKDRFHVNVTIPYLMSYNDAEIFVLKNKTFINQALSDCEFNMIDENFCTKTNNLIIKRENVKAPVIKKRGRNIYFYYPLTSDFYSKEIQESAALALKKAMYIEAKEYLPKRVEEIAKKYGFKYGALSLKAHKTRWGSCSYNNNINLNINLMSLEKKYIDCVILHELVHTVEKNHKEGFYNLFYSLMPEAEALSRELKKKSCIL